MPGAATGFGPGTGANPAPDAKQAGARAELALEGHAAPVANARRTPVRPGAPVVLEVRGLAKNFEMRHQGQRLDAFTGVGFSLHAGEFLLLRGPNGAGKSTLLRTIYRSYLPAAGEVILHTAGGPVDLARAADVDISLLRRREIGFVTQFLIARPRVYAEETVAEPLLLAGAGQAEALRAARAALAEFGVKPDLWRAYPTTFPGGEQQKVNLARALILPQRLLMLDEPTASLDAGARAALVRRLGEMKAAGVAMIGVFQHPADVAGLIDGEVELKPTRLADDHAE